MEVFEEVLSARLVEEVLASNGVIERRRGGKLPPTTVFWLLIHLALDRASSVRVVLGRLALALGHWDGKPPHSTSVTQARDKVGWVPFRECLQRLQPPPEVRDLWIDKTPIAIDGGCLRAANSAANVACLGKPTTSKRTANWPLLRTVVAAGVQSHWVYDATFAPYVKNEPSQKIGEAALATGLLGRLPTDAVVVCDRAYSHFSFMKSVMDTQRDFVVRATKTRPGFKPRRLQELSDGTDLVCLKLKSTGEVLVLRRVRFTYTTRRTVPKKNKKNSRYERTRALKSRTKVILLTSLLDPNRYPREALADLYRDRWEVEHVLKEIKCQLAEGKVPFRGQTVERVLQEAYANLIVFNCLRAQASAAAEHAGAPQLRVSFELTLRLSRAQTLASWSRQRLVEHLAFDAVLPKRRPRHYPREVLARTPKYRIRKPKRHVA